MRYSIVIFTLLTLCAMADSTQALHLKERGPTERFQKLLIDHPEEVFLSSVAQNVKDALKAFRAHERLPNGLHYGDSVRDYSLEGKLVTRVRADMKAKNCRFKEDVIRNPNDNLPKPYLGKTTPLWIFLCPDGGVVRVKPEGDPTNPYRRLPHGNKSLRYPYDSKFENFSDEVVKVDNRGQPVPKSRADLAPQDLVDAWSADAHTDLGR